MHGSWVHVSICPLNYPIARRETSEWVSVCDWGISLTQRMGTPTLSKKKKKQLYQYARTILCSIHKIKYNESHTSENTETNKFHIETTFFL